MDERLTGLSVRAFVERLATSDPVPGGGSAAALVGAMGAALLHMVVELTSGRTAAAEHAGSLTEIGLAASQWQSELLNLAQLDADAYGAVVAARRLPSESERDRQARATQLAAALREATRVPLATASAASEVLELAERLAPIGSRNAISDVGVAGILAAGAVRGAALNVEINLPYLTSDAELREKAANETRRLLATLDDRDRRIRSTVAERLR
jgi:formiminotetrahydrofolate cyclodeaminase